MFMYFFFDLYAFIILTCVTAISTPNAKHCFSFITTGSYFQSPLMSRSTLLADTCHLRKNDLQSKLLTYVMYRIGNMLDQNSRILLHVVNNFDPG